MDNGAKAAVWGGAGEHGRSCYFIQQRRSQILFDCGGKKEVGGVYPLLDPAAVPLLDAVFLSHAHEDHSMAIPLLYRMGYGGKVWTTRATARQLPVYFSAWREYVGKQDDREAMYGEKEIQAVRFAYLEDAAPPGEWFSITPSLRVCWGKSGHMLGAVWLLVDIGGKQVFYSGDFTTESRLLAVDWPSAFRANVDLAIVDSAYGDDAIAQTERMALLKRKVSQTLRCGGSLLFPVPAFGRGQELLIWTREQFPRVSLVVERELLDGLRHMTEGEGAKWLQSGAKAAIERLLADRRVSVVTNENSRIQALEAAGRIFFTTDGSLESDKAKWYYARLKNDRRNCLLFTGHLAKGSYGERLLSQPSTVPCEVQFIRYKSHQGVIEVSRMLEKVLSPRTILAHSEPAASEAVRNILSRQGYQEIYSLMPGDQIEF